MSNGTVIQIIGAVIDVEFEKDNIPKVYEALTIDGLEICLLYTSPSPRDKRQSRMPSSA